MCRRRLKSPRNTGTLSRSHCTQNSKLQGYQVYCYQSPYCYRCWLVEAVSCGGCLHVCTQVVVSVLLTSPCYVLQGAVAKPGSPPGLALHETGSRDS
jgi:hypothetical protein